MDERKTFFLNLNPIKNMSYDLIDTEKNKKEKWIVYVYKNNRENGGYFFIMDKPKGEEQARIVYVTEKMLNNLEELKNISVKYIEMDDEEFQKQKNICYLKNISPDTYFAKIKHIITGEIDTAVQNYVIYSAKMSLIKLFGNNINIKEIVKDVTEEKKCEITEIYDHREAISEVLEILQFVDKTTIEKVPLEILKKMNEHKSINYLPKFKETQVINEEQISNKAKAILAVLYKDYISL